MCKRDGLACMRGLLAICLTPDLSHNITNMFVDPLDSLALGGSSFAALGPKSSGCLGVHIEG